MTTDHLYQGGLPSEWLHISVMDKADDRSNIVNWVDVALMLGNFPLPTWLDPAPTLTAWNYLGKLPGLAQRLDVEEAHAYTGMAEYAQVKSMPRGRLYLILAKRNNFGWRVALSLPTAVGPGMPEEFINSNDHIRAAATLAHLRLGPASGA